MRITFLGTGTSHGVPSIDCMRQGYQNCLHGVCLKAALNPRHRRTRSSITIEQGGRRLLIDTSQDFREQVLREAITRIDAIFYTHGHADHIFGLPDTRSYTHPNDPPLPIYASRETLATLRHTFSYVFQPRSFTGGGIPLLEAHVISRPARIAGFDVTPIPVEHGPLLGCLGYRIGNMAYIPDVHTIPSASLALLRDLDLLIINCLRPRPHANHLALAESLHYVELIAPRRTLLTHMTHDIDYELEEPALPAAIRFAHDGLQVSV